MFYQYGFCIDTGDDPKYLPLDSGKIVDFIRTFGPLVSFLYYLMLVLCILEKFCGTF